MVRVSHRVPVLQGSRYVDSGSLGGLWAGPPE